MLQWDWPKTWSAENEEVIRAFIENSIRKVMSKDKKSQIRGIVSIDELNLGSIPPEVSLSGIRVLSAEHTAIMVKVRYNGDFSVRLRGLEINLDTVSANVEEADANFALPFFCPFEMTLQDILLEGMVSIEIFHDMVDNQRGDSTAASMSSSAIATPSATTIPSASAYNTTTTATTTTTTTTTTNNAAARQERKLVRPPRPSRSSSARGRHGYGVLLGGGGRRAMRPPNALDATDASLSSLEIESAFGMTVKSSTHRTNVAPSFADIFMKRVAVKQRTVKVQLFGDPLKSFRVVSNFSSVPGANSKVEGMMKMLIRPAIEGLMTEGIVFTL